MTHKKAEWYRVIDINIAEDLSIECPRCLHPHILSVLFDKEIRNCPSCDALLAEWNIIRFIYLIDVEKAPKLVQNLAYTVQSLGSDVAFKELEMLHDFFGNPLYD